MEVNKAPLLLSAQPEGRYPVTSPKLPVLLTHGGTRKRPSPVSRTRWLLGTDAPGKAGACR